MDLGQVKKLDLAEKSPEDLGFYLDFWNFPLALKFSILIHFAWTKTNRVFSIFRCLESDSAELEFFMSFELESILCLCFSTAGVRPLETRVKTLKLLEVLQKF